MKARLQRLSDQLERSLKPIPQKTLVKATELSSIFLSIFVIAQFIPKSWFNSFPATGGDMGSHFWPVKVLHDYGIPNLVLRPWNPGNNGGEGLLVHYFPLPFILMSLLGYVVPLGTAFNIGTLLPVLSLPVSVWLGLKLAGLRYPATVIGALFSSVMVLNEGYSMWGGNTLSTLAGQFCHMYALNFLIIGIGALWKEINDQRIPWQSGLLFAAVALSHGYIYFGIPPLILLTLILHPKGSMKTRALTGVLSGLISLLVAAWFIGPMMLNGPWVTPHSFFWEFSNWVEEIIPRSFEPIIASFTVSILIIAYRLSSKRDFYLYRALLFWIGAGLVYLAFFFIFRALQLVDVRALPQTQLFWSLASALAIALAINPLSKRIKSFLALTLIAVVLPWVSSHVIKFPVWLDWNYSGWETKSQYPELLKLSAAIRGNLSEPRIAYEHHTKNNFVGTERVFEMLPYFSNRATTESLYLQSTILAPMIFSFTSEISEGSSCPFSQWPCLGFSHFQDPSRMELLGIRELILSTDLAKNRAREAPFLRQKSSFGHWTVFESTAPIAMAETFSSKPETIPFRNFRDQFWNWYKSYGKSKSFLVTAQNVASLPKPSEWVKTKDCKNTTQVDFSGITLQTTCPGIAHFLKYAYHPSFTSSGGEPLFLVSPGFLGVVPQSAEIKITFGSSWTWTLFRSVSILAFLGLILTTVTPLKNNCAATWESLTRVTSKSPSKKVKPKVRHKKNKIGKTNSSNQHRWIFIFWVALIASIYIFVSYKTDSILFWQWRQLNFSDFEIIEAKQDWGALHKNESLDGSPLVVKGSIYYSSLTTHANSEIKIRLKKQSGYLVGKCAYPDSAFGAQIQCEIKVPSHSLFVSNPLNNDNREQSFKVPLTSDSEFTLVFKTLNPDINSAHAAWLDLKIQN